MIRKPVVILLALFLVLAMSPANAQEDPITISILTMRHSEGAFTDVEDLWFFRYLPVYLEQEYGLNVKLELEQTLEPETRLALMLATGDIPDLIWGITMGPSNMITYGMGEQMLMDWTPYLNQEAMPNAYALMQKVPDAFAACTLPDGNIYGLPYIAERTYNTSLSGMTTGMRLYVDQTWLNQCNLTMPTTLNDFTDMLRAFKQVSIEGKETIPMVSYSGMIEKFVWASLGFYGNHSNYGTSFSIKDDQVVLPCNTEEYRAFVEYMHMLYTEGLIPQDHFTMDVTTLRGMMADGVCGVLGDYTLIASQPESFKKWVCVPPASSEYCDMPVASMASIYQVNMTTASAKTKHPDVLTKILDFMYSDMGSMLYLNGPMAGTEETLGIVDGWTMKDNGEITNKMIQEGKSDGFDSYGKAYIYSSMYAAYNYGAVVPTRYLVAGVAMEDKVLEMKDAITGERVDAVVRTEYSDDNADGWWRITTTEAWENNVTTIRLPVVYLSEEETQLTNDLKTVIENYVTTETAKFIVGARSLDELDAYFDDLKTLGVDTYTDVYTRAYANYMDMMYNK